MDKALRRIQALAGSQRAEAMEPFLERLNRMSGANRLFKRIAYARDVQQLDDCRAEILYALMFAGLAFDVSIEPEGAEGPDLSVCRDGHSAAVEVTRFRRVHEGPPTASSADMPKIFQSYGDPLRDVRKVREKVTSKFRQLSKGTGIVAIWNDDGDLEELEACQGVAEIAHDSVRGVLTVPPEVFLVIYASEWTYCREMQRVYCFELRVDCPEHQRRWSRELESSSVQQLLRQALSLQ
ncbi:hypothetical protein KAX17_05405 [Candidatus Bipolaricaulota bacterium]|nr:hypothetical protein [Candidatus Bipolaricaulota bacterium]